MQEKRRVKDAQASLPWLQVYILYVQRFLPASQLAHVGTCAVVRTYVYTTVHQLHFQYLKNVAVSSEQDSPLLANASTPSLPSVPLSPSQTDRTGNPRTLGLVSFPLAASLYQDSSESSPRYACPRVCQAYHNSHTLRPQSQA